MSYDEKIRILFEGLNKIKTLEERLNSAANAADDLQASLEAANDELDVSAGRLSRAEAATRDLERAQQAAQRRFIQPRTASGRFAPDPEKKKRQQIQETYRVRRELADKTLRDERRLYSQQEGLVTALGARLKQKRKDITNQTIKIKNDIEKIEQESAREFARPVIRESYARRTTSIAERQIAASKRLTSKVGLSESRQMAMQDIFQEINTTANAYRDLTKSIESGIIKDETALLALERSRRSLASTLTSQVEKLREIRRTNRGSKVAFDRVTRLTERREDLESTLGERGITSSERKKLSGAKRAIKDARGSIIRSEIESSNEQLDIAERLISKLERAETRRARAERARNKVIRNNEKATAKSVSLANQETKARERLLDIENKIRAGKRISIEQAADLAFFREPPSPPGGAGGRSQLMLPAAAPGSPLMSGGARRRRGAAETMLGGVSVATIRESIAGPGIIPAYLESIERPLVEGSSKVAAKAGKASSASFAKAFEQATPLGVADNLLSNVSNIFKGLPKLIGSSSSAKVRPGLSSPVRGTTAIPGSPAFIESRAQFTKQIASVGTQASTLRRVGGIEEETFARIRDSLVDLSKKAQEGVAPIDKLKQALELIKTGVSSFGSQLQSTLGGFDTLTSRLQELRQSASAGQTFRGGRSPEQSIDEIVRTFNASVGESGKVGKTAASNIGDTFSSTIASKANKAATASMQFATKSAKAILKVFGIASPSKFIIELVRNLATTWENELRKYYPRIQEATKLAFDPSSTIDPSRRGDFPFIAKTGPIEEKALFAESVKQAAKVDKIFADIVSKAVQIAKALEAQQQGLSSASSRLLPPAPATLMGQSAEQKVVAEFLRRMKAAEQMFAQNFSANSYLPQASRGLAAAMQSAGNQLLLAGERSAFTALPSAEMIDRRKFSEAAAKALEVDAANAFREVLSTPLLPAAERTGFRQAAAPLLAGQRYAAPGIAQRSTIESEVAGQSVRHHLTRLLVSGLQSLAINQPFAGIGIGQRLRQTMQSVPQTPQATATRQSTAGMQSFISGLAGVQQFRAPFIPFNWATSAGGSGGGRPPVGAAGAAPGDFNARFNAARQGDARQLLTLAELADPARASIMQLELLSQALTEFRATLRPTEAGFERLNRQLRRAQARTQDQLTRRDPGADILTRRLGARGAQGASEALIGGAFPLLFGQGAFASLGGGLGGGIGGFVGGSLGFGLSLLGTAAGQAADSLIQAAKDTGAAYKDVVANFDAIKESSIISSSGQEQLIQQLIEGGKVATAYSLIQSELNDRVGSEGVGKLQDLATASDRMGRAVAELGMQLQVFVAGPVTSFLNAISNFADTKNTARRVGSIAERLTPSQQQLLNNELKNLVGPNFRKGLLRPDFSSDDLAQFAIARGKSSEVQEIIKRYSEIARPEQQRVVSPAEKQKIAQQNAQEAVSFAEDRLQSLNLAKEIQDFGQQYSNQIRAAQREQDDANRQSFEIRRDYEQQIGEIRLGIEDRIRQTNIENRQKEIAILQKQGQILEASFANASASLRANLAGDELAISLADAVDTYLSSQLSAQNEIENRRRQFEFEIANQQLELEKYKIDVAKNVSRLNVSTAERVRQINLNIARRNEDVNAIKFNTEKEITLQRLAVIKAETEQARIGRLEQLQMLQARPDRGTPVVQSFIADLQKTIENLNKILSGPTSIAKDIERIQASRPQRLSQIPGVPTQGVDFSGVDATAQRRTELSRQFKEAEDRLTSLLSTGKFIEFNNALRNLAVSPAIQRQTELTKAFRESAAALGDTNPVLAAIDDSYNNYINNNLKKNTLVSEQNKEAVTTLLVAYRDASKELEGLAETQKFYIDANSGLNGQLADTRDSINQLLQPTSQYERLLSIINASGGISVNQAENERILELARNVDTLNTKLKQLNFINDIAGAWTDSFIGFNKELIKTGNLGKSIEQWAENIADRSIDLALEFILRPIQEQMFKDVANFLGFEAQNPQLKALSSIDQTLNELKKVVDFAFSGDSWKNSPQYKTLFDFGGASTGMGGPTAANSIVPGPSNTSTEAMSSPAQPYQAAIAENRLWESAAKFVPLFDPAANSINVFNNSVVKAAEGLNYFTSSASTAAAGAGAGATPSDTKVSESMEKFSKTIGSGIQVMSGIAMAYGGAKMIGKGGIFNTLMGLSSIFGGISSLASGISKFPGFANGGRPTPGEPAWIGEEGMELWVPDKPGTIVPMDDIYIPGLDDDGPAPSINGRYSRGANSGSGSTGVQGVSAPGSGTAFGQSIPYQRSEFSREVERIDQVISNPGELPPVKVETQAINSLEFVTPQQLEESSNKTAQAARRQTIRELADSLRTRRGIGIQ